MKSKIYILLSIGILLLSAADLNAQVKAGSFSISPMAGYSWFAEKNFFEDTETYGASIGYNFSDRFGLEATYNILNTEVKPGGVFTAGADPDGPGPAVGVPIIHTLGGVDVDAYQYALEAIFYIYPGKKFAPYGAIGVGRTEFEYIYDDVMTTFTKTCAPIGFGFKYFVTDMIAVRADLRSMLPMDDNNLRATVGLTFQFGGGEKVQAAEREPVAQAPPAKDSDGDGVYDYQDRCPNTPAGIKVNSQGCPMDSDGDGVSDDQDRCPNTPAGVKVDSQGCPLDSDGDGISDDQDRCPNTPAGVKVNSQGCPLDGDGDGVADNNDQCPNTPKGATVDSRGCWTLNDLEFDTNKAKIKANGISILDSVVAIMQSNPSITLEIQGHTDNKGSAAYNKTLSQKRAQAVMDYLIKEGIAKDRLTAVGYGIEKPAATNNTEEGRAMNRRVELKPIQ